MVDCSHANSRKDFRKQMDVARDVAAQLKAGEENIMGVMVGKPTWLKAAKTSLKFTVKVLRMPASVGIRLKKLLALLAEAKGYQA